MRTTLEIDEKLLAEAQRLSGAPTRTAAIELGLRRLIELGAARRLALLGGAAPRAKAARRRRFTPGRGPKA